MRFKSILTSFVLAIAVFGLGIGAVYATVTIGQNIQIGSGTPDLPLDGDSLYVTGTFEVDGASRFDGAFTANATSTFDTAIIGNLNAVRVVDGQKFTTIQEAIDDLPPLGGTVMIPPGDYEETIVSEKPSVHLLGMGASGYGFQPSPVRIIGSGEGDVLLSLGNSVSTIMGGWRIENITFRDVSGAGALRGGIEVFLMNHVKIINLFSATLGEGLSW